ncbi:MAG: hypothetical protein Q9227_006144 [Pyrenula ochraceoflavens]
MKRVHLNNTIPFFKRLKESQPLPEKAVGETLFRIKNGTFYRQHPSVADSSFSNPPLFPGLNFQIYGPPIQLGNGRPNQHSYAVVGRSGCTPFLDILRGQYVCVPPEARSYPLLASEEAEFHSPQKAIQYVGFNNEKKSSSGELRGAYLSARYESRREETDWTLLQYLKGETELNPPEKRDNSNEAAAVKLDEVLQWLRLQELAKMPVSSLSNGQLRRAKIAKALVVQPKLLLLDEPFMGLDPPTQTELSSFLRQINNSGNPRVMLSLRPQDPMPYWITHLIWLGDNNTVALKGKISSVLSAVHCWANPRPFGQKAVEEAQILTQAFGPPPNINDLGGMLTEDGVVQDTFLASRLKDWQQYPYNPRADETELLNKAGGWTAASYRSEPTPSTLYNRARLFQNERQLEAIKQVEKRQQELTVSSSDPKIRSSKNSKPPLVHLRNVVIKYGEKAVLGGSGRFNLLINPGTRLAVLGPNGSGKTTLLSLLTSDHPQSYSLPIKHFGRTRLPTKGSPGISLFDIQSQIGHSSPEIHAFFPSHLSVRQTLQSAFAETFLGKPSLNPERDALVTSTLHWFAPDLDPSFTASPTSQANITWADSPFGSLSFHHQRLLLLLRAFIKSPRILILDEAFSGLPIHLREKAMTFLECGETMISYLEDQPLDGGPPRWARQPNPNVKQVNPAVGQSSNHQPKPEPPIIKGLTEDQALVAVSHVKEEIPECVDEWLRLPGEDEVRVHGKRMARGVCGVGRLRRPEIWDEIWRAGGRFGEQENVARGWKLKDPEGEKFQMLFS